MLESNLIASALWVSQEKLPLIKSSFFGADIPRLFDWWFAGLKKNLCALLKKLTLLVNPKPSFNLWFFVPESVK